ncbi:MAG: phosphoribosylpyrophosphate synthetase [Omnitrophica bacterium RIFCSPLOWO2_02_FULL_45_16]|nr:MAG: phosphoribosylpyrophosphate synthetase [Omnitrophica bacterium RIFCSPHIGHO2_02_FULL_46_20]OGW93825.1 MAG: phosphoribosylpyrophosphate synthetase [Omnitrophica bacterium RIFCSPLOWO2_12_FULL_45_13]OGW94637.1 MAG: phosphoribosylpyrophosphate synthetase [Omnitrophica bacterium RIFCSPLOWO2_01_FULL_45_24]OGX00628.1 MAG: phosphoribosylpyrophosphate synthetase [Omnitrophica bacterium RIFCSPLOWO2_02_FULL_45_16]
MKNHLLVFSGNSNKKLALDICKHLKIKLGDANIDCFSDGETRVKINQNARGHDVFVIQSISSPANESLMELLIMIDALKRASAQRITAVLPYFGYARQDRKDQPRVPITAKLVANLLTVAGADRVLTVDLHAGQIQGFFDIPLDHLFAFKIFADYRKKFRLKGDIVIVSPDVGSIKTARAYAKRFRCGLAIVDKRRVNDKEAEVMHIMGDVKGKVAIIVDDMVATAGSLVEAVEAVKKKGALEVYAAVTHPVLCGPAIERIKRSQLKELIVTDTIPIGEEKMISRIKVLSVAPLLAEAIKRIHNEVSLSVLFK